MICDHCPITPAVVEYLRIQAIDWLTERAYIINCRMSNEKMNKDEFDAAQTARDNAYRLIKKLKEEFKEV